MELPKRKQNRLKGYDYSQNGVYFVTICAVDKKMLFWKIVGERNALQKDFIGLSDYGEIADQAINQIEVYYSCVLVNKYVIMPNHIHMILQVDNNGSAMRSPTVSNVVNQLKGFVTKQIGFSPWQKSFHDHIIRNEKDYQKIWEYIDINPLKWEEDCFYCENKGKGGVRMFHEICIYEAKIEKQEEIEELMQEVSDFYRQQEGVVDVGYIKRTHRQKDFHAVKEGELPIRLTRYVGKVTYVLHWVVEDETVHACVSKLGLELFYKRWARCLTTMPKIILGENIVSCRKELK